MSKHSPVSSIEDIISGLGEDLSKLRSGDISLSQARVSADLAKQYMSGVRLMIKARKSLEGASVVVGGPLIDESSQ